MPKYGVIYADPPWEYRDKSHSGKRGSTYKYPSMSDQQLRELPVKEIAAKDSFLFLWTTAAKLPVSLQLVECWGFRYINLAFTWVKTTKRGKPFVGMGSYTRNGSEFCLLGKRGKPKVADHAVRQVLLSPIREHSRKPDEIRDLIVRLTGDVSRVELFSRQLVDGWESIGNEVDGEDIRSSLQSLICTSV